MGVFIMHRYQMVRHDFDRVSFSCSFLQDGGHRNTWADRAAYYLDLEDEGIMAALLIRR